MSEEERVYWYCRGLKRVLEILDEGKWGFDEELPDWLRHKLEREIAHEFRDIGKEP